MHEEHQQVDKEIRALRERLARRWDRQMVPCGAPDAGEFFNAGQPDTGANTLGHIAQACAEGRAEEGRSGPLRLPNLDALGLGAALRLASGLEAPGLGAEPKGRRDGVGPVLNIVGVGAVQDGDAFFPSGQKGH